MSYIIPIGSGIIQLPFELLYEIVLDLPAKSLIQICQTNKWFQQFCSEQNIIFWKSKLEKDYNWTQIPVGMTEKQLYFSLATNQAKIINIEYIDQNYNSHFVSPLLIFRHELLQNILTKGYRFISAGGTWRATNNLIVNPISVLKDQQNNSLLTLFNLDDPISIMINGIQETIYTDEPLNRFIWNQLDKITYSKYIRAKILGKRRA